MEEEKSIFDTLTKTCIACGQTRTLRNFKVNDNIRVSEDSDICSIVSNVCKCCEKHPELQLKSNRVAIYAETLRKIREKKAAREHQEQMERFNKEKPIKVKKHKVWKQINPE